jgi:large subunit ribosomal protein L1
MYNIPNAPIYAHIELNMVGEKVTRIVDNFHRIAKIDYKFNHGEERKILVFTRGIENIEAAKKAGATMAGDASLIKAIQNGDLVVNEFQYVLAHTNMLPDLTHIRGLMKRRFPSPKNGTLGNNLEEMIQRFLNGITYSAIKDENQQNFAEIVSQFGTLDMNPQHLEDNLSSLLKDIDIMRPKREGKFITRVWIKSPPSKERFKINPFLFVPEEKDFTKKPSVSATSEEELEEENIDEIKREAVN